VGGWGGVEGVDGQVGWITSREGGW